MPHPHALTVQAYAVLLAAAVVQVLPTVPYRAAAPAPWQPQPFGVVAAPLQGYCRLPGVLTGRPTYVA